MKAILLPYCIEQNEPSKPLPFLYDVPEDKEQRDAELMELFNKYVCEMDPDDPDAGTSVYEPDDNDYGDVVVVDSHTPMFGDLFLFVTFIKETT